MHLCSKCEAVRGAEQSIAQSVNLLSVWEICIHTHTHTHTHTRARAPPPNRVCNMGGRVAGGLAGGWCRGDAGSWEVGGG